MSSHHQKWTAHEKPERRATNLGFFELANEASRTSLSQGGPAGCWPATSATSTRASAGPIGRLAPALETLDAQLAAGAAGHCDFAFIDADKTGYDAYYERCLQLLRPGGLVAIDNTLWSGSVARPAADADTAALQQINIKLRDDTRVDMSLLTIGDGLTLARKR